MRTGRPIPPLELRDEERETLQNWARRPKSAQALAWRARMILLCAEGNTNTQVAGKLDLRNQTVGKWRQRFVDRRREGLLDEPRPGTPRRVSDAEVERVLTMTLESVPKDATQLEHAFAGGAMWAESQYGEPDLARILIATASQRDVQVVERSIVHREGSRHRGTCT